MNNLELEIYQSYVDGTIQEYEKDFLLGLMDSKEMKIFCEAVDEKKSDMPKMFEIFGGITSLMTKSIGFLKRNDKAEESEEIKKLREKMNETKDKLKSVIKELKTLEKKMNSKKWSKIQDAMYYGQRYTGGGYVNNGYISPNTNLAYDSDKAQESREQADEYKKFEAQYREKRNECKELLKEINKLGSEFKSIIRRGIDDDSYAKFEEKLDKLINSIPEIPDEPILDKKN